MNNTMDIKKNKIVIIHKKQIPDNGYCKILHENKLIKNFLPNSTNFKVSWLSFQSSNELLIKSELLPSLIYVYQGSADLESDQKKHLKPGDLLLIPSHCNYKFINIARNGLYAIQIQFNHRELKNGENLIDQYKSYPLTFDGLMIHNQLCLKKTLENDFFKLLTDDTLSNANKRYKFLDCVQVFSDYFQIMMFSREATCDDKTYIPLFLKHLHEEFGHNELLAVRKHKHAINDPILHASSSWFCYQMFVLDNVEKTALVHLILETGGSYYGNWAKQKAGFEVSSNYFDIHSEGDDEHALMGTKLLKGHSSFTYKRLHHVIDKGWDKLNIMLNRIAFLINQSN
jgi:hypothetical protein